MNEQFDVAIVGGGAAGAAAALQLARIRRSVVVIDAGEPRNAPAAHMHGYPGFDGEPPSEFVTVTRAELERYGVTIVHDRVTAIQSDDGEDTTVTCAETGLLRARRVLLTTGLTDLLPDIPGLTEHWGRKVIHCPWCHGWEVRDQRIAVLDTSGMGTHQALLFSQLSDRVTIVLGNGDGSPEDAERLALAGVHIEHRAATAVETGDDALHVVFADGAAIEVDAVVVAPGFRPNARSVEDLVTVVEHRSGLGSVVAVDATGRTADPYIYAAGNVVEPMQQVIHAAANGNQVAGAINTDLFEDDLERIRRSNAEQRYWDGCFLEHEQMFSGRPNGSLEHELSAVAPGRVLDVGCGEGADAIWLAQHGWDVTAIDISPTAVERARAAAAAAGVSIEFRAADVATAPPSADSYDLITMSYPALKKAGGGLAAIGNLGSAVVAGGELLVIGHGHVDREHALAAGFDPEDYVSIDDVVAVLGNDFRVTVDEVRDRPNAPDGAHHHHDRVLRATRRS